MTEGPAPAWDSGRNSAPSKGAPRRKEEHQGSWLHGRLAWQRGLEGPQALAAQQMWLISEADKTLFSPKPSPFGAQMYPEITLLSLPVARPC